MAISAADGRCKPSLSVQVPNVSGPVMETASPSASTRRAAIGSGSKADTLTTMFVPSCIGQRTRAPAKGWPDLASRFCGAPISRPDRRASSMLRRSLHLFVQGTAHCEQRRRLDFFCTLFWRAKSARPTFPPLLPLSTASGEGRETQAVQSRFAIGNTHLKNPRKGSLVVTDHLGAPSADEPSDIIGLPSLQRGSLQHYAPVCAPSRRCCTPFRVTLVALTWEGSPVVSQCSYGGVMRHYLHPVVGRLYRLFLGWVLSPT